MLISLDTNILVRLLVNDDQAQVGRIERAISGALKNGDEFFISNLVILETIWVLKSCYNVDRSKIIDALDKVLRIAYFSFERMSELQQFIAIAQKVSVDLADIFIGINAVHLGAQKVYTLDKKAGNLEQFEII